MGPFRRGTNAQSTYEDENNEKNCRFHDCRETAQHALAVFTKSLKTLYMVRSMVEN